MNIIDTTNEKEVRQEVRREDRLKSRVDRHTSPRLRSRLTDRIRSKSFYETSSSGANQSFGFFARF